MTCRREEPSGGKSTSATVPSRRTWKPSCPRPFLLRVISTVSHPTVSSCTEGTSGQHNALFTVQSGVDWHTPAQSLLEMKHHQTAQQREFSFRINAKLTGGWENLLFPAFPALNKLHFLWIIRRNEMVLEPEHDIIAQHHCKKKTYKFVFVTEAKKQKHKNPQRKTQIVVRI